MKIEETLRALYDEGVDFVIIGGAAMQIQGSARLTEDLDIAYSRTKQNIERLARAIKPFHPRLRNAPENLPFQFDATTIQRGMNFTLVTDLGSLDFLGEVSGLGNYDAVAAESETINIFGLDQKVLSIKGLLKAKKAAGRKRDLDAITELEALQEYRKKTGL